MTSSALVQATLVLANAFGYLSEREAKALINYAHRYAHGVLVNIGAGAGTSGLALAAAAPSAQRYTIDQSPGGALGGLEGERNAFAGCGQSAWLPVQILERSEVAGVQWTGGAVDFIFIDGDHSDSGLTGDLSAWLCHLKPSGSIGLHDYGSPNWGGVRRVADRLLSCSCGWRRVLWVDTLAIFRRPLP